MARLALALSLALAVALGLSLAQAVPAAASGPRMKELLLQSSSWSYQLQGTKQDELGKTAYDLFVIDAFFGGGPREIAQLREKPFGSQRRILLAYLSVGEAQVYRYYWKRCCAGGRRPDWVTTENKRWPGNFRVRFWDDEWKDIIYRDDDSYLKRIIDAGFDGVYLDRADVHLEVSGPGIKPRSEMVKLVAELSAAAKKLKPEFLVVVQNAEDLVEDARYRDAIDGIAKEDLFHGEDGRRKPPETIQKSMAWLEQAQAEGKHVMVVEYLNDEGAIDKTRTEILERGFVPYFAPRTLQRLKVENLELDDSH